MDEGPLNILIEGVVHRLSNESDTFTECHRVLSAAVDNKFYHLVTLDPVNCVMCIAAEGTTDIPVYRCKCSWVGSDPDWHRGRSMCPACWHHDRKRVEVVPQLG